MRTLLLTPDFLPRHGGIQHVLGELCSHWPSGEELRVATYALGGDSGPGALGEVPVQRLSDPPLNPLAKKLLDRVFPRTWSFAYHLQRFFPELLRQRPDAVICGHVTSALAGYAAKILFGANFIVTAYAMEIANIIPSPSGNDRKLTAFLLKSADGIASISSFTDGVVKSFGVPESKIFRFRIGAGSEFMRSAEQPDSTVENLYPGKRVIFSAARLVPRKGMDTLIRALPRIAEKIPNVLCVIAGEGDDRARLENLVRESRQEERVLFTGKISQEDLIRHYRRCDVFALLNRQDENSGDVEGFGVVFLEAGACGKTSVGGNNGGVPDAVIHEETGLLVDATQPEEASEALIQILSDDTLRSRLSENARHFAHEHNWSASAAELLAHLKTIRGI